MNAIDIMTVEPITLDPAATVLDALRVLHDEDIRHIPVVDDGELLGILSDRDLRGLFALGPGELDFGEDSEVRLRAAVSDVMSPNPVSVLTEATVEEVIDLMLDHRVGALPVVDDDTGELAGIISYVDVIRALRQYV